MNVRERLEAMLNPNADGLLPCPWCGSTSVVGPGWGVGQCAWCPDCEACGPRGTQSEAIAAWNSRPFIRALLAAIEQRDEALADTCDLSSSSGATMPRMPKRPGSGTRA